LRPLAGHQPDAGYYLSLARFIPSMGTVGVALDAGWEDDRGWAGPPTGRQGESQRHDLRTPAGLAGLAAHQGAAPTGSPGQDAATGGPTSGGGGGDDVIDAEFDKD
jgi:hypothetical protein